MARASQAEIVRLRRALGRLSGAAAADWAKVIARLARDGKLTMGDELANAWCGIIEKYGAASATLAADKFAVRAKELGLKAPVLKVAKSLDARQALSTLGWALSTLDQRGNTAGALDRLVLQPYRDTMQNSALASHVAFARIPEGGNPCDWCLEMAGRGAVYSSEEAAGGDGNDYHANCQCVPEMVRDDDDMPEGHDPASYR